MKLHYIFVVLLGLLMIACHDDVDLFNEIDTDTPSPETIIETEGFVIGYVYDENNEAVPGVQITTYDDQSTTDANGVFRLKNSSLDQNGTYIQARKEGYIFGSDMIYPKDAVNYSYIQLFSMTPTASFDAGSATTVELTDGGSIAFQANSIIDASGNLYSGTVNVTAKRIAADDPKLGDKMPGALLAQDNEGYTRVLGTLGMMAVELRTNSGEELNLDPNKPATLNFQLSESQLGDAPSEIALWYFDEERGLWLEDGRAVLDGNKYVGEVTHFSFWNCDAPFPLIHLCGQVVFDDGTPVSNHIVLITTTTLGAASGYTDGDGVFCGKVPKNAFLTIVVTNPLCAEESVSVTVGPFSTNVEIDDIVLPGNLLTIFGVVSCNGDPIEDGYVVIGNAEGDLVFPVNENGLYEINAGDLCLIEGNFEIFAVNAIDGLASNPIELDADSEGELELNMEVCSNCDFVVEISQSLNGGCSQLLFEASVDGGSGDYDFLWSNGESTQVFDVTPEDIAAGTVLCVTVTDNINECDQQACITVSDMGVLSVNFEVLDTYCDAANGEIYSILSGGTEPYEYLWTGPNGFNSTDPNIVNIEAGLYSLLVTDVNGCEWLGSVELENFDNIGFEYTWVIDCGQTTVIPIGFGGTAPYTFSSDDGQTGEEFVYNVPGEYCITIEDSEGCIGIQCITVWVEEPPVYFLDYTCEGFEFLINFFGNGNTFYEVQVGDESFGFEDGSVWSYNVLEFGFEYTVFATSGQGLCLEIFEVTLPNFDGLIAEGVSPSCMDCEDGWIEAELDPDGICFDCTEDVIAIYSIEDLETDLTDLNDDQMLSAGTYIVAVLDTEGCVVAFEEINL